MWVQLMVSSPAAYDVSNMTFTQLPQCFRNWNNSTLQEVSLGVRITVVSNGVQSEII